MRDISRSVLAFTLFTLAVGAVRADKEFDELLKRVPDTANAIVLIDAESLYASSMGQKEQWSKKHQQEYLGGAAMFPSTATHAVMAAQLDQFGSGTTYEIGLAYLRKPITMPDLAKFEAGTLDNVSGLPVVRSPRNCFFVDFTPQVLGTYAPASRQEFSRWVKFGQKNQELELSPYLAEAAKKAGWKNQVVMAFDTADMINPKMAKLHLAQMDAMAGKKDQIDGVAKLLSGMKGVRVVVAVTSKLEAELSVDFTENIRAYASLLKPVLLEVLMHRGAHIEALEAAELTVGDNSLTLKGPITEEGLRKMLAIIQPPAANTSPGEHDTPGVDPKLTASRRYYTSITTLLKELRGLKTQKIQDSAWWHVQYANKIDELPILNVDEDLLAYGGNVSGKLRSVAASLGGASLKNNALEAYRQETVYATPGSYSYGGGYGYGYGGYGGYYQPGSVWYENNYQQIWAAGRENTTKSAADRDEVWRMIDSDTGNIRKKMTLKFNTEF